MKNNNNKGFAIEMAIGFMALMFAMCIAIMSFVVSNHAKANIEEDKYIYEYSERTELDQIGDDFLNAVENAEEGSETALKDNYDDYVIDIQCYSNYNQIKNNLPDDYKNVLENGSIDSISREDAKTLLDAFDDLYNLYIMRVCQKEVNNAGETVAGDLLLNVTVKEENIISTSSSGNINAKYTVLNWSDNDVSTENLGLGKSEELQINVNDEISMWKNILNLLKRLLEIIEQLLEKFAEIINEIFK